MTVFVPRITDKNNEILDDSVAMPSTRLQNALLCWLFLSCSTAALAAPVTWIATLSESTWPNSTPEAIMGSFVYDADTHQVLSWDVAGFSGCILGPTCGNPNSSASGSTDNSSVTLFVSNSTLDDTLTLDFRSPLTDDGGTAYLMVGSCQLSNGYPGSPGVSCGGPGFTGVGDIGSGVLNLEGFGGSFSPLSGSVTAIPEPSGYAAILLFSLAAVRRYEPRLHRAKRSY